jgi:hypothetical protein
MFLIFILAFLFLFLSSHAVPTQGREDKAAQYSFARKVTEPCGAPREVLESVTREEVINMIMIVKGQVEEARYLTVSIDCFFLSSLVLFSPEGVVLEFP